MPLRRSSATASPSPVPPFSTPPPSTRSREHSNLDSWSISDFSAATAQPSTIVSGEGKIISTLVGRLVNKLPCNSGIRLSIMEVDPATRHTVDSLLSLCKIRPTLVFQSLGSALETLSKYSASAASETPLDTLHSQLFLLQVLLRCLSATWRSHAERNPVPHGDLPRPFPDLPQMDEALGRYLLAVTLVYVRLISTEPSSMNGTSSPALSRETRLGTASTSSSNIGMSPASGSSPLGVKFIQQHSFPSGSTSLPLSHTSTNLAGHCPTTERTVQRMEKVVSRIIFILSSANWHLILSRLKNRISHLTTTIEDSPDFVDLRLLEWSNLNRSRLSQVLQEISSTFLHVKRPAQISIAVVLRRAIWNRIDINPSELDVLIESNRKIEGGADVLFDVLHSASDPTSSSHAKRTRAFYPLMTMLLVICPDMLKRASLGESGGRGLGGLTKKLSFLESLRKGVNSSKGFEACTICYVDFLRAAMSISPRLENSGLRSITHDIQSDLRNALFHSPHATAINDPDLLVDGLVALYRANPETTIGLLFGKILADNNEANRLAAIRACRLIQLEDGRLPWHPPSSELRDKVAAGIRQLLKESCAMEIMGDPVAIHRPRASPTLPSSQNDLVIKILELYLVDPTYAMIGPPDTWSGLLSTTSSLGLGPSPGAVRDSAGKCNIRLIQAMSEEDETNLTGCGDGIWQLLIDVSRQGLHVIHFDHDEIIPTFQIFRETALAIARFAEKHPDILASSIRGEAAVLVAMVAIVSVLVSPDFEQLGQSTPALKAMKTITLTAHKMHLPGVSPAGTNFGTPEARVMARAAFFDAISTLPPAQGRQQQQRQFRKVYRTFAKPHTGGIAMWLGLRSRAKALTSLIIAADGHSTHRTSSRRGLTLDIDGLDEGQAKTWQNAVLFLAATASVCQYDVVPPPSFADSVGRGLLPRVYEEFPDSLIACDDFVRECVDLLSSGSVHVRETVKEALGSELPASLGRVMCKQITTLLGHSMGQNGVSTSDTYTIFVDQVLAVLRLLVERIPASGQDGVHLDLGELLSLLLQYITRLGRDEHHLRIKIKFCQTIETILDNSLGVILHDSGTLRNHILETLVDWTVEAQRDREYLPSSATADSGLRILHELDLATLRTIVPVTEGLILKASSDELETSSIGVKTRLFYRYYTHLTKILERGQASADESGNLAISSSSAKMPIPEDASSLAISALSNLLSANLDVGLKHCLSLGYHEQPALRTAFMRLLTSILQQGTRFHGLLTKRLSAAPKPFTNLLVRDPDNLALAISICEVCPPNEIDEVSMLLFRVLEAKGLFLSLVKTLAEREIALTNHESELFRGNSITTRILTIFARTYGYNYVRATLQPLVHSLVEKPAECSFELDPSKAGPNDDIEQNADHLQLMCQALLDLICSSTSRVPIVFRALCHHLWEVTADRYPEARHSVVGSFIFLRFFCPAIVAPENIDLEISPDTREIRRALLLITKVIQNLANNVTFGNKEPHMKVLDGFLSENIRQVSKFLSDLGLKPRANEIADALKRYQEDAERVQDADGDEAILSRFIVKHHSKLEASLGSLPPTFRYEPGGSKLDRQDLKSGPVEATLRELVEKASLSSGEIKGLSTAARSQAYDEFMRHNAGRDVESVAEAFYEGPISQNGRRIFYFIVSRVGLVDYDLLAYHVFSVLDNITDFFDLVIDLTDFSAANELPMAWLKRSIQICPPSILPCINVLALYNPNSYAKRRIRWILSEILTVVSPAGKQFIAASTPGELSAVIPFASPALPEYTLALAYQSEHVFTNLLCLTHHEHQIPVVVRLGHDCLQIASWRKQDLVSTVKSYIIDLIRLRDIDDVITGGPLPDRHIMIKYGQNETMTFISGKRSELAQIIRAARARLRDGPSGERTLRPSDVPGTLLNVALMNLSSGDQGLRLGAYNLIYELSGYFKWDTALSVLKITTGLNIPNNAIAFSHSISAALAHSAPHLTLDFLKEWTIGFSKGETSQKCAALNYVGPWLDKLDLFARPTRERSDVAAGIQSVQEIVRTLVTITLAERRRLHLSLHEHVWSRLARAHESLVDIITLELIHVAIDAGFQSEKAECVGDILVSISCTAVRGRVIARLRKTIAKTYVDDSPTLTEHIAWAEIATLSRIVLALSFNPTAALDAQLFLPDLFHIITLLVGYGPVLMRQTIYGLTVNTVQSLATSRATGDMDTLALQRLLEKVQSKEVAGNFGLVMVGGSFEPIHVEDDVFLSKIEDVTKLLGEVLIAGAVSFDCANAWRARWMSLVVSTCFQHNPAIQPQAYTVLGYLAIDEVDDDLAYQVLGTMGNTLADLGESDNVLVVSMLRCFCRIVPGLQPNSRYHAHLFWVAIAILQLGYIPLFAAALELLLVCLRAMPTDRPLVDTLLAARSFAGDPARKLDEIAGVSFETDPGFSFVGVLYKGVRHPSTKKLAMECMLELLKMIVKTTKPDAAVVEGRTRGIGGKGALVEDGVGLFMALLPLSSPDSQETKALIELVAGGGSVDRERSVMDYLTISDASTAMLIITLVTTILQTASSETERIILYGFLAEASIEMPEVVAMSYDSLIPRMISVLSTTTNIPILDSVTSIMERAMLEPTYTFPNGAGLVPSESMGSLQHTPSNSFGHGKNNAGSISSFSPSLQNAARDQALDDLGLRSLAELSFVPVKWERVSMGAKWIAALIDHLGV